MSQSSVASPPVPKIKDQMDKVVSGLLSKSGWVNFMNGHKSLFDDTNIQKEPYVNTEDLKINIDGKDYVIGLGARSVSISANPKTVVSIIDNPHFFQSLYGLDKPADIFPVEKDGTYKARIFKYVPGVRTQNFTLDYQGHWEEAAWIGQAKMDKDEMNFALRDNVKIVEPKGDGSIYREVALFFPLEWWMNLLHGTVQSITKSEMKKLNKSIKCASEKVQSGTNMSEEIGKACWKEASK